MHTFKIIGKKYGECFIHIFISSWADLENFRPI